VRVRVRIGGRAFALHLAARTDLEVLNEIALEDEYGAADDVQARTIVDLGAHIGLATLRLLARRPDAHVIAVEADPRLVGRLRRNVASLPVTVVHAAIAGASGSRTLYRSDDSAWGNALRRTLPWQQGVEVPALSLGDLLEQQGLAEVDLLKVDVEGAEWELFADGVPAPVAAVAGEVHALDGSHPRELLARIEREMELTTGRVDDDRAVFVARRPARRRALRD
jgi:FkbM family methyltransferase